MSKETKFLDYNTLIRDNLLNVVKQALNKTADYGLTDGHHFYITFTTKFKENSIPTYLTKDYPENMMIVIENEYYNLKVFDNYLDLIGAKSTISKTKKIQQKKNARLENKSNIIYLKPNK